MDFPGDSDGKASTYNVGDPSSTPGSGRSPGEGIGKDSDAWRDWGQEEKGMREDEMVGWHHQLNGHECE